MRSAAMMTCSIWISLAGCRGPLVADEVVPADPIRAEVDAASERSSVGAAVPNTGVTRDDCEAASPCLPAEGPGRDACVAALAVLTREERVVEAYGCAVVAAASADGRDGRVRRALLLEISHGDMGQPFALVVGDGERFHHVVPVLEAWQGVNGEEDLHVDEMRLDDVVGDGEPEVVLRTRSTIEDAACTEPLTWSTRRSEMIVCTLAAAGAPTCTDRIPLRFLEIESTYDDESEQPRVRRVTRFAMRAVLARDAIVVTHASGRLPRTASAVLGRYRVGEGNVLVHRGRVLGPRPPHDDGWRVDAD